MGIGTTELIVIMVVTLIVFGPQRLPELAKYLAKFMKMVREASSELQRQIDLTDWDHEVKQAERKYKKSSSEKKESVPETSSYTNNYGYPEYGGDTPYAPDQKSDLSTYPTSETLPAADHYAYNEIQNGDQDKPAVAAAGVTKPQPIDDPAKVGDAQRYSREMND